MFEKTGVVDPTGLTGKARHPLQAAGKEIPFC